MKITFLFTAMIAPSISQIAPVTHAVLSDSRNKMVSVKMVQSQNLIKETVPYLPYCR